MGINKDYLEEVRQAYQNLSLDELLHEYYGEKLLEPHITDEAKLAIEELFTQMDISIEEAFWKHQALMEAESYLEEDKSAFPPLKVIGRYWFHKQWLESIEIAKQFDMDTKPIESIEKYYESRSVPLTEEQQAQIEKLEDELQTMIHYGKYKPRK